MTPQYDAALQYIAAGWRPIPLTGKVPALRDWPRLDMPSQADAYAWWADPDGNRFDGVGIVCGPPSGNLLVVDIEGRLRGDQERLNRIRDHAHANGVGAVYDAAWATAAATTPSGGLHLFYRVTDAAPGGNQKLAFAKAEGGGEVLLAETRGLGGQVGAPPGPGRAWTGTGRPGSAIPVTSSQMSGVLQAFQSVDESVRIAEPPPKKASAALFAQPMSMSVAAALEESLMAGELTWEAVLDPGWTFTGYDRSNGYSLWLRPDNGAKSTALSSAHGFESANDPRPVFVVHSSSVRNLPIGEGKRLTPARVFAYCWFDGDERVAYQALEDAVGGVPMSEAVAHLYRHAPGALNRVYDLVKTKTSRNSDVRQGDPLADPESAPTLEPSEGATSMPVGLLSPLINRVVATVSAHTQTAPELATFAALAALSAATAGGFEVKAGWDEPVALYAIAVADPSERKSAVLQLVATDPLRHAQDALASAEQPRRQDARAAVNRQETAIAALKKSQKNGQDVADALAQAEVTLAVLEDAVPPRPDFILTEATTEAMEQVMRGQFGCAAVLAAEGTLLKIVVGHYSDGRPNVNLFNQAWSHEYMHSARVKRGSEPIERPHVSLGLIVQPTLLQQLSNEELVETGFTARWLMCYPSTRVGARTSTVVPLDYATLTAWREVLLQILRYGWGQRHALELDDAAATRFRAYCDEVERTLQHTRGSFRTWLGKSTGQLLRIAALIALTESPMNRDITIHHLEPAIAWMGWQRGEVRRLFTGMNYVPMESHAQRVIDWYSTKGKQTFSLREAHMSMSGQKWLREAKAEGLAAILDGLVLGLHLEELPNTAKGQRMFRVLEQPATTSEAEVQP